MEVLAIRNVSNSYKPTGVIQFHPQFEHFRTIRTLSLYTHRDLRWVILNGTATQLHTKCPNELNSTDDLVNSKVRLD
jgi:hypothetical protein